MATLITSPESQAEHEPELNLLRVQDTMDQPLWNSLLGNLRETLFPPKLPPLQLTSKPVQVRDIWGEYNYKKKGATGSLIVHLLLIGALIGVSIAGAKVVKDTIKKNESVTLIAPDPSQFMPISSKKNDTLAGGGGGGDRDKLQAPKGHLPKFAME